MATILEKLLAEKQALLERLTEENIGPAERDEIERLLENVEAALQSLDRAGPGTTPRSSRRGEEPQASGDEPGDGGVRVTRSQKIT